MSQATEAFIYRLIGAVPQLQPLREKHVEDNFSPDRMVSGYEQVYRDCLRDTASSARAPARDT